MLKIINFDSGLNYEEPQSNECFPSNETFYRYEIDLVSYTCGYVDTPLEGNESRVHRKGAYSESATLLFGTGILSPKICAGLMK